MELTKEQLRLLVECAPEPTVVYLIKDEASAPVPFLYSADVPAFSGLTEEEYLELYRNDAEQVVLPQDLPALRNMYSIFVRQYSEEGTFEALRKDLSRIRNLGTDIIWLMPIHPIGEVNRKGSLGSPYAIRDYRSVNPEFGTMEDFKRLVSDIHDHHYCNSNVYYTNKTITCVPI